jgi:hypothetical protein
MIRCPACKEVFKARIQTRDPGSSDEQPQPWAVSTFSWRRIGILAAVAASPVLIAILFLSYSGGKESLPVTMEQYRQLKEGMSYLDVCHVMNDPGKELSKSGRSNVFTWTNPDGTNLTCVFLSGRLVTKGQSGLK